VPIHKTKNLNIQMSPLLSVDGMLYHNKICQGINIMPTFATPLVFLGAAHNHTHCIAQALEQAAHLCQQRGVRLTPLRRQVLELVWQTHKPIGAYTILELMSKQQEKHAAPPTVYRALDFLLEQGLIHRISSLNAFIGCWHPQTAHVAQFLICENCGNATEFEAHQINTDIAQTAEQFGFKIKKQTIELTGLCYYCQSELNSSGIK
jgi:Fur family zinc uptake transcriptional regulator